MPGSNHLKFFGIYFASPKAQSFSKVNGTGKTKVKSKFFTAFFVFLLCLIFFSIYKYTNCLKIQKAKKIKRDLRTEFNDFEEVLKVPQNDIEIVPENQHTTSHYPNHRYTDDPPKAESKVWPSKQMGLKMYPENIKDVIPGSKVTAEVEKFSNEKLKVSGSSMRLKGIYKQSGSNEGSLGVKNSYSKAINNLMQYNFMPGEKRHVKHPFRARGSPFRLPVEEETWKRQKPNLWREQKLKLPITIYLDFYPINPEESRVKKVYTGLTSHEKSLEGKESINVGKFALSPRKQNGIVMTINLYPKSPSHPMLGRPARGSLSKFNKTAERKSFGWFIKDKKKDKHPKECTFMGLNPRKNHITAKWKNEKGEWIHAAHVDVKYLKKEKD